MFSGVSLSPAAMLKSGCQTLELREREYMEVQGAGVCCCTREKQRKKEKIIFRFYESVKRVKGAGV